MKTNIFIPEKIKVGFQERSGTYTGKLAYVIYYDQKGTLRKEKSWQSWRDQKIQDQDFENTPTSGFVLNKKAGGYSTGWNHRQTYVRVYDPRDFEFEISIPNLLYILENTNSIKGKGLEGEFVYGWDGTDLILIPTSSPDYTEISKFNKVLHENKHVKSKDLVLGGTYKTKDNDEWIYMGRFDYHTTKYNSPEKKGESGYYTDVNKGKHYFFAKDSKDYQGKPYLQLLKLKSLGDKFIEVVSSEPVDNYAAMFESLEHMTDYSPYDKTKDEYIEYTLESFINKINSSNYWDRIVYLNKNEDETAKIKVNNKDNILYSVIVQERVTDRWFSRGYSYQDKTIFEGTLEEIHSEYKPMYRNKYLVNGKLYQKGE
ncbi:hypothetical protein ADS79_14670 [Brevibacillus reuszeri]|uniref:Uncharacterized protein n=1 Tax=Brevibacillus reuszeri TaxID=54915 RepID=A0A0K9YTA8_9BACL|nr:hypothetical protein ADS79_14670 [Brevibacillus reuszeri]